MSFRYPIIADLPSRSVVLKNPPSSAIGPEHLKELIESDDPGAWAVARDAALEREFTDLVIQIDMATELGVEPSELTVEESDGGGGEFRVRLGRSREFMVVADDDTARRIAVGYVADMIKDDPSSFNQDFIGQHIDQKKLKEWVYDAAMEDDYADEIARHEPDRFWEEAAQWKIPKLPKRRPKDIPQKYIDALKEKIAEDRSREPMSFFEDMYSREDAIRHAIDAAGIDVDSAAEEAVNVDGWEHFLATYDGNSHTTRTGYVYWRTD
jgi:hypothetical protein